jgi:hypothetical protein
LASTGTLGLIIFAGFVAYYGGYLGDWGRIGLIFCFGFCCFAFVGWDGVGWACRFLDMAVSLFTHLHISFSSFFAASLAGFEIDELSKDILLAVCNITFL